MTIELVNAIRTAELTDSEGSPHYIEQQNEREIRSLLRVAEELNIEHQEIERLQEEYES